ncbi:hypothetical protein Q8F55_006310 [Vanrija albida]|uniref:Methyltransferase domain-containing protein n=1 Tax=Vanrija albida TaxID=181172 RepID=A0ABR3PWQ5_9TREE
MGRPKTPIKFGLFGHHGHGHDSPSASASAPASRASSVHSGHQPSVYAALLAHSVHSAPVPPKAPQPGIPQGWDDDLSIKLPSAPPVPAVLPPTPRPQPPQPATPGSPPKVYAGGKAKGSAANPGAAWAAWEREHLATRTESDGGRRRAAVSSTLAPRPAQGASKHVSDGALDHRPEHRDNLFGSLSRRASRMASLRVPRPPAPPPAAQAPNGNGTPARKGSMPDPPASSTTLSSWKSVRRSVADASSAVSQYYHTHTPSPSHSYAALGGGGAGGAAGGAGLPPSPCPSSPGIAPLPLPSAAGTPARAPSPLPPTPRSPPHSPRLAPVALSQAPPPPAPPTPVSPPPFGSAKSSVRGKRPHTAGSTGHTWSSSGAFSSAGFAAPFGLASAPTATESEASVTSSATDFSNLFTRRREGSGSARTSQSVHHYRPSDMSLDCATPTTEAFASWESAAVCDSPAVLSGEGAPSVQSPAGSGWYEPPTPRGAGGVRRVWRADGREVRAIYKVGYERAVLDLEARLHETMYEVANGRHSFVDAVEHEPGRVLDLGTGTGLWPISAALQWPETHIVGADIVPVQIDLDALVAAEVRARTSSAGMWASVASRIKFEQYNFLDPLPYEAGSFDMVHMRFLGLGVPETRWAELLDEAMRVLKPGGVLEIVEMSFEPPPTAPPSVANSFSSLLLSDYVQPNPLFALQLHLPATHGVAAGATRPVFTDSFAPASTNIFAADTAPGALADAAITWIRSALEYKGTAFVKAPRVPGCDGDRAGRTLSDINPVRWPYTPPDTPPETPTEGTRISLAAWVVRKEAEVEA